MPVIRLFLVVLLGLVLPQVLGYLGYRWTKNQIIGCKLLPLLIPPLVFFVTARIYWGIIMKAVVDSGGYVCGALGAAAGLSTVFGTLFHFILGIIVFLIVSLFWRMRKNDSRKDAGNRMTLLL
jgi:hypothetical protein